MLGICENRADAATIRTPFVFGGLQDFKNAI